MSYFTMLYKYGTHTLTLNFRAFVSFIFVESSIFLGVFNNRNNYSTPTHWINAMILANSALPAH